MLSHPNIISYFDSFEEEGTLWIEMEYADGGYVAVLTIPQLSSLYFQVPNKRPPLINFAIFPTSKTLLGPPIC